MPPQIRMSEYQGPPSPHREAGQRERGRFRQQRQRQQQQQQQEGREDDEGNDPATRRHYRDLTSRHDDFVRALERHGSNLNSNDWPMLAEDLGWSIQEVQSYAFQYLISLLHRPAAPTAASQRRSTSPSRTTAHQLPMTMNGGSGDSGGPSTMMDIAAPTHEQQLVVPTVAVASTTSPMLPPPTATATNPMPTLALPSTATTIANTLAMSTLLAPTTTAPNMFGTHLPVVRRNRRRPRPWSLEESVLFDTLVATYMPVEDPEGYDWEELVAAQLPGRSAIEIRRRWHQLLGRSEAQQGDRLR